jgi:hypothetical protein
MAKIRLGLARVDSHSYYYSAMINQCDPMLLHKHDYLIHHYMSSIYSPKILTMPQVDGFEIGAIYDRDIELAKAFSETFMGRPVVCEKLEDVLEHVDAFFVSDCDGSGDDHLELARPFLENSVPTFVDKPFAFTLEDAIELVRLAEKHNTLMFNASILSYVPAAVNFKNRFAEFGDEFYPMPTDYDRNVKLGLIKGVGGAFSQALAGKGIEGGLEDRMAYIIHGVSLALHLFGTGVDWVEAMGELPLEYFHLHLKSGVDVMILNSSTEVFPETCNFYASAYGKFGAIHSGPIGDPQFLGGAAKILEIFRDMCNSGKAPKAYQSFIEPIAVIEAGQQAQTKGARVYMKDVLK